MNERIPILRPLAAIGLWLALALAAFSISGCTVYSDPGYYEESYDDEAAYADTVDDSYVEFGELEYWGQWFDLSPYGSVWRPTVVLDWEPFTNGQWMWTNFGWTWVSYEPFGWATYHYGWWARDFAWGWIWVPDYEWHPARVEWITYDDYIGWAPLRPRGYPIGDPWTYDDCDCWHVVPIDHFTDDNVGRHTIRYKDREALKERSSVIYHEPDATMVEAVTHRTIRPIKVDLVRASKDARVEKIKLPREQSRVVARYKDKTEEAIRPKEARQPTRVEPPAREDRVQDKPPPQQDRGGDEKINREPPPQKEQPKKDRAAVEKPKKEQPKKREPEKKPRKEKPKKEEPKKEDPEKDDPQKEDPKKDDPKKDDPKKELR